MITSTKSVMRAVVFMIISGIVTHCLFGWLDNPATYPHWPATLGVMVGSLIGDVMMNRRKAAA